MPSGCGRRPPDWLRYDRLGVPVWEHDGIICTGERRTGLLEADLRQRRLAGEPFGPVQFQPRWQRAAHPRHPRGRPVRRSSARRLGKASEPFARRTNVSIVGWVSRTASRISPSFAAGAWHCTARTSWQGACDAGDELTSHAGDGVGDVSLRPQRRRLWVANPRERQVAGGGFRCALARGEWRPSRRSGSRRLRCTWWRDGGSRANLALRSGRARLLA